ncbi:hypothetical protein SDC9_18734 [bioreactor metagenome]|nr:SspF family protein [Desulfitobacterium hafniense DP7]
MQTSVTCLNGKEMYFPKVKGGIQMSRRRSTMSDNLKQQIAQELGFSNTLNQEGFSGVSSRDCGNMVKKAIEIAERNMAGRLS